ncbi:uncharacterized protein B0H18DRAFT_991080 [Fomitopsis serialis]|uniref:uncharacterized protein n=1 Tax=Fomitopsis serialis TaxID=139415 RepID=UPI002007C0C2|nr:uncharacterized protein B0H18DRAFT_991080 [Neoantrodia serialis]KAH9931307.1 hypothetical protein B0H18DRAFT_991080 [Neoantrodia serialis]
MRRVHLLPSVGLLRFASSSKHGPHDACSPSPGRLASWFNVRGGHWSFRDRRYSQPPRVLAAAVWDDSNAYESGGLTLDSSCHHYGVGGSNPAGCVY